MMLTTELMVAEVFEDRAWIITRLRLAAHSDIRGFIFITQGGRQPAEGQPFYSQADPRGEGGVTSNLPKTSRSLFFTRKTSESKPTPEGGGVGWGWKGTLESKGNMSTSVKKFSGLVHEVT